MADYFLAKSSVLPSEFRKLGGGLVIDRHAELEAYLNQVGRADIASLFATPMIGQRRDGGPTSVSWYSDHRGNPRTLASLDGAMREDVSGRLAEAVDTLRALAVAPETNSGRAALIDAALSVRSAEDILVVGGHPVLINWATAPESIIADPDALAEHFRTTFGAAGIVPAPGVPTSAIPGHAGPPSGANLATPALAQFHEATPPRQGTDTFGGVSGGAGKPPSDPPPGDLRDTGGARPIMWWPPLLLILLMALLLTWLLLPGTRLFPPVATQVEREISDGALDLAQQINRDLEQRANALETALEAAVCTPEGDLLVPGGRTPEGLLPPALPGPDGTPGPQQGLADPLVPPDPARVLPGGVPGETGPVDNLIAMTEARTVLVLVPTQTGVEVGTGFFIAPDVVATNFHVVAEAIPTGAIFVLNDALATPRSATVLQFDGPFDQTGADFALLRVAGVNAPFFALVPGSLEVKGQAVTAAGYPTDIIANDQRFQRLVEGLSTEAPDLVITNGIVNSEQRVAEGLSILVHSASISRGNSGGPLVDLCGRVVGVNTFISTETFRNLNLAQSIANFERFLSAGEVTPTYSNEVCLPSVRPTIAPSVETVTPEEAAPTDPAPETDPEPAPEPPSP